MDNMLCTMYIINHWGRWGGSHLHQCTRYRKLFLSYYVCLCCSAVARKLPSATIIYLSIGFRLQTQTDKGYLDTRLGKDHKANNNMKSTNLDFQFISFAF